MKSSHNKGIAVISGDIVNSSDLTAAQYERLLKRIKDIQAWISEGNSANAHSIERGDEFQSVVHDYQNALRYTIIYRVAIKALGKEFESRISVATSASADVRATVSESMGGAFVLSGRGLKALKNDRLIFTADHSELAEQFDLLIKYLDRQLTELTPRQCEVMLPMLQTAQDLSISDLAKHLGVAVATVSKSLKASGWPLIDALNSRFITHVKEHYHV
ncbi:ArsR family transcriptional regulator [Alteromonas oceanisediminis]|uniref:ArsR family transcriptional regulator n=1 Tax=Alteromonas oceanisediminis TaxID=2836180 RepID=UPI00202396FC|nr:ArsR family transcriptional regulator [Alteromonas oceanisediminis]